MLADLPHSSAGIKTSFAMQVLLSGAELGCSQEALSVVAVASTDPIYFAPRCVNTWCPVYTDIS